MGGNEMRPCQPQHTATPGEGKAGIGSVAQQRRPHSPAAHP